MFTGSLWVKRPFTPFQDLEVGDFQSQVKVSPTWGTSNLQHTPFPIRELGHWVLKGNVPFPPQTLDNTGCGNPPTLAARRGSQGFPAQAEYIPPWGGGTHYYSYFCDTLASG